MPSDVVEGMQGYALHTHFPNFKKFEYQRIKLNIVSRVYAIKNVCFTQ